MLPWPYAINSIEMNYGYIATSLKIVLLKGNWLKTKDRKMPFIYTWKEEYSFLERKLHMNFWERLFFKEKCQTFGRNA